MKNSKYASKKHRAQKAKTKSEKSSNNNNSRTGSKKSVLYALEEEGGEIVKKEVPQLTFELVGNEVLNEKLDPRCWAKALATGVKTKDEALSVYAKLRAEDLTGILTVKESKAKALEQRRLVAGNSETATRSGVTWRRDFSVVWDFLFWQILLSVSGVGLFLVLLAMGPGSRWWPGLLPLVAISAALQLAPFFFYTFGKMILGRVSYVQALGATAVVLVSFSAVVGIRTMTGKKLPSWVQVVLQSQIERGAIAENPQLIEGEEF